jgi:hypothetical protein
MMHSVLKHDSDGLLEWFSGQKRLCESSPSDAESYDTDWNRHILHSIFEVGRRGFPT